MSDGDFAREESLRLHFLGTGGSEGIPCLSCSCGHCEIARQNPSLRRYPTSLLLLNEENEGLLVDAGTDVNRHLEDVRLQGVALTHWHADHWTGLPRLSWTPRPLPLMCPEPERAGEFLKKGLVPLRKEPFSEERWGPFRLWSLPLRHSVPTWGYLVEDDTSGHSVALLWDTKGLPAESLRFLQDRRPSLAVVDATYPPGTEARNHNNVGEAVELGLQVAREVFLTHFSHQNWPPFRLEDFLALRYPSEAVALAYDGLKHDLSYPLGLSLRDDWARAVKP